MRKMFWLVIAMIAVCCSCGYGGHHEEALAQINQLIKTQPDSALHCLESLDTTNFTSEEEAFYGQLVVRATKTIYAETLSKLKDSKFANLSSTELISLLREKKENADNYSRSAVEARAAKDYNKAFMLEQQYAQVLDTLYTLNRISEVHNLEYKYHAEMKRQQAKAQTRMVVTLSVSAFLCLLFIGVLVLQSILHRQKEIKEAYKREMAEMKEVEEEEKARLCNSLFMETEIYSRIEELSRQNRKETKSLQVLVAKEQDRLKKSINEIYGSYISHLKSTYPKLTDDDCMYCCLHLCNLDDATIAYCFGNTNKQIVAQRRMRLKVKMLSLK